MTPSVLEEVFKAGISPDLDDPRDIHEMLRADGIRLDADNRADATQRITAHEPAELLGLPPGGAAKR